MYCYCWETRSHFHCRLYTISIIMHFLFKVGDCCKDRSSPVVERRPSCIVNILLVITLPAEALSYRYDNWSMCRPPILLSPVNRYVTSLFVKNKLIYYVSGLKFLKTCFDPMSFKSCESVHFVNNLYQTRSNLSHFRSKGRSPCHEYFQFGLHVHLGNISV